MSDSPVMTAPVGPQEKPILEKLLLTRDKLLLLKQDKSTYVKSSDVLPLYEEVIEQVSLLNGVRGPEQLLQNRVDTVLDDCLQLISLFFMAVGRNNEAPALYAMTGTITRLCRHLLEAAFYSKRDLTSLEHTLNKMQATLESSKDKYSEHLLTRIHYRLRVCQGMLQELHKFLATLSPEMTPIWEKLVSILRAIAALNTRSKYSQKDLNDLREQLLQIKATMKDGGLPDEQGEVKGGQNLVVPLLERCLKFTDIVEQKQGKIDERFKDVYDQLIEIRNQLERLTMTQAWSLRETDLFMWQRKLDRIDDSRRDGNFFDAEGHPADLHAQRTLLYLLRRGYAYIYQLLIASEPVSEALLPIYNQLLTLRKCLVEVKKAGGVSNPRELYPYSMKLNSIDNMRVDGKFQIGNDIPEGQGSVNDLLAECYDLAYDLRTSAEEENEEDGTPPPCNACIASNTECIFREDLDGRRKEAIKRKADDAEHHRDLLGGLLRSIRWSEESDAQQLVQLIREDAPLAAINAVIDAEVTKLRGHSPGTDATIDGLLQLRSEAGNLQEQAPLARARRKTMSVEQMSDEPLFRLTAKPWTTVTEDDYLVSHLASLYFTWWNTFMHPLHEPALIDVMEKGDPNSLLCSPFLVNAMLALACGYSDLPGAFSDPDDPETWGEHFYDEAKRLWDREEGHASLINLQGLYLLLLYCNMHGKDQLGWSMLSIMVQMYQDLGLSRQTKIPRDCPPEDVERMRTAMLNASWSVFVCNTMFAMFLLKRPTLQPPTVERPYAEEDLNVSVQWRPYPRLERVEPLYGNTLFNAYCDFAEIAYEVALSVPFTENEDKNAPLQLLHRLQAWHDDLPENLRAYPEAPGPLFELHAIYYWCALTLSEVSDREPSRETTPPRSSSTSATAIGVTVRSSSLLLIREMLPLYRGYRQTYGAARVMAGSCQAAAVAYFILLKALRRPSLQSEENEGALIDLTVYLMMGARRWLVYAGIVRMLRPTAQSIGVQLPQRLTELLDEFDKTVWTVNAHRRIKSVYPNLALVKKEAFEDREVTMGELLAKWEGLSTDESNEN